jgi:hypothetical protein
MNSWELRILYQMFRIQIAHTWYFFSRVEQLTVGMPSACLTSSVQTEIAVRARFQLGNIPFRGLVSTVKWFSQSVSHSNRFTTIEIQVDQLETCYTLCAAQDKQGLLVGTFEPDVFRRNWETFIREGDGVIIGLYSDNSL